MRLCSPECVEGVFSEAGFTSKGAAAALGAFLAHFLLDILAREQHGGEDT